MVLGLGRVVLRAAVPVVGVVPAAVLLAAGCVVVLTVVLRAHRCGRPGRDRSRQPPGASRAVRVRGGGVPSPVSAVTAGEVMGTTRVTSSGGTLGLPSGWNLGTLGNAGGRTARALSMDWSAAASLAFWAARAEAEIGVASRVSAPR